MVFNATFNNISDISWRSVLLVEETVVPADNHWPVASHWQIVSHNVVWSTPRNIEIRTHNKFELDYTEIDLVFVNSVSIMKQTHTHTNNNKKVNMSHFSLL